MSLNESNAAEEIERLLEPVLASAGAAENMTALYSAPAPRKRLKQIGFPKDRDAAMLKAARSVIEAGIRTPEAIARFLDATFPSSKARQYSQAFWDFMGIVDPALRGTHDWQAIYARLDKPTTKPARKKAASPKVTKRAKLSAEDKNKLADQEAPAKQEREILESMPPPWRDVLQDHWKGKNIEEIAAERGMSLSSAGFALRMGQGRFQVLMDKAMGTPPPLASGEPLIFPPATKRKWSFRGWLTGEDKWRMAWEAYNSTAFHSVIVERLEKGDVHRRVMTEVSTDTGKLAIILSEKSGPYGRLSWTIHAITKKMEPSGVGAFWVSAFRRKWKRTGRRHLVDVLKAHEGYGFHSSSAFQRDKQPSISCQLIAVVEANTDKKAALELHEFAYWARNDPKSVGNPKPD